MSISHRFQVHGLPGDYDECEPLAIEIRCTHCGRSERYGDDQMTTPLMELIEWADAHKCHRGQHTNTTGRSTDRPTNGRAVIDTGRWPCGHVDSRPEFLDDSNTLPR